MTRHLSQPERSPCGYLKTAVISGHVATMGSSGTDWRQAGGRVRSKPGHPKAEDARAGSVPAVGRHEADPICGESGRVDCQPVNARMRLEASGGVDRQMVVHRREPLTHPIERPRRRVRQDAGEESGGSQLIDDLRGARDEWEVDERLGDLA